MPVSQKAKDEGKLQIAGILKSQAPSNNNFITHLVSDNYSQSLRAETNKSRRQAKKLHFEKGKSWNQDLKENSETMDYSSLISQYMIMFQLKEEKKK